MRRTAPERRRTAPGYRRGRHSVGDDVRRTWTTAGARHLRRAPKGGPGAPA